jgi:1,4-alpha-glucan branching enzyme
MRICLVTFDFPPLSLSGIAAQSYDLACYLSKEGVKVHVLTAGAEEDDNYSDGLFKVTRLKVPFAGKLRKLPYFQFRVWRWLEDNNKGFDIIHFQQTAGFLYLLVGLFNKQNNNTIEVFHHSQVAEFIFHLKFLFKAPRESLPYLFIPLNIFQEYICVKTAKLVITDSKYSRSALISWGINSSKIVAIPNALGEAFLRSSPAHLPSENSATKLLYVGMLVPRKGVDMIVEAVNILKKKGIINFHVDIAGQGPLFAYCQKLIEKNNLKNCTMRGLVSQQELQQLYQQASCLICPSRLEGFGIVLLEAGYNGLAIIANDIPVFKEIFSEDEVIYFKRNDPYDLAQNMSQLIDRPDLVSSLREKARNKVQKYMWQDIIKNYIDLYSNMVIKQG